MAVRETIQIGNTVLRDPNKKVDDVQDSHIQRVIQDLIDTMRKVELVGMAAPQIAENYQIFVTEPRQTKTRSKAFSDILRIYINPRIMWRSRTDNLIYEGCGSVVHGQLFGPVKRPQKITIEAQNEKGKLFRLTCDGLLARIIQHECDHLEGKTFVENVDDYSKLLADNHYIEQIKGNPTYETSLSITELAIEELEYL